METKDFKTRSELLPMSVPSKCKHWVIGLDIGYSAVKGVSQNKYFCYPAYARKITDANAIFRELTDKDIQYRENSLSPVWAVGALAYTELSGSESVESDHELFGRMRYNEMFRVIGRVGLALGLMGNVFGAPEDQKIVVQTGLPPKYLSGGPDKEQIKNMLAGFHEFDIRIGNGAWQHFSFSLSQEDIYVMPQPMGALFSSFIKADGTVDEKGSKIAVSKNVIVFDPGFGTLDDYVLRNGKVSGSYTYPEYGMYAVFSRTVHEISEKYHKDISILDLQNYLEDGTFRFRKDLNSIKRETVFFADILERNSKAVCAEALQRMYTTHDYFSDIDYIIATGGTYDAWKDQFHEAFSEVDDLEIMSGNQFVPKLGNIFANVRGYYYYRCNRG